MDDLAGARVLVTGATGFIGSHLCRRLLDDGAQVHALTSTVSSVYPVRLVDIRDRITLHGGNLTDSGAMDSVVERSDPAVVFHLGAYTHVGKSWDRVDECIQTNIHGSVNLLQALARSRYRRFVYTSTSEVYGDVAVPFREDALVDPLSPYAVSKYAGERFCRMLHRGRAWPIVVVRPFNAYGPAQSPDRIVPEIIVKGLRRERLAMTEGRQTREFNYVEDLVDGFVRAATVADIEGEVFNIGGGEEISMRDLATTILALMGDPITAELGALPDRPTEIWSMRSDVTKASARLGLAPARPLREGLERTISWYRQELEQSGSLFSA
ncbi:MAG TPA: NAD-dependent epimerase/dehydratase family protein [Acidimicrobiales bacterium]|nr:NAD-dependent epimerase/dehydratase family protein [Acidimicrobiales bacterium]